MCKAYFGSTLLPAPAGEDLAMSTVDKLRCAFGLFSRPPDLERAVAKLREAGLGLRQIKVILPPRPAASESPWAEIVPAVGVDTWIASEASEGSCPWDFTPLYLAPSESKSSPTKRDVIPGFHIWAVERHTQQLDHHLRSGGAIVVVQINGDAEERATYSILLRFASAGVQTHEIGRLQKP